MEDIYKKASELHQDYSLRDEYSRTGPGHKKKDENRRVASRTTCEVVLVWTVYAMANRQESGVVYKYWTHC